MNLKYKKCESGRHASASRASFWNIPKEFWRKYFYWQSAGIFKERHFRGFHLSGLRFFKLTANKKMKAENFRPEIRLKSTSDFICLKIWEMHWPLEVFLINSSASAIFNRILCLFAINSSTLENADLFNCDVDPSIFCPFCFMDNFWPSNGKSGTVIKPENESK